MTADALSGSRLIAMALLQPGYEKSYHTLNASIHPVVCVGRILREERLPDGRFNFLLQGLARGRVLHENHELRYRRAKMSPLPTASLAYEIECAYRHELQRLLSEPALVELADGAGWLDLVRCNDLPFSDLLDVVASAILPDVEEKQAFLAEPDTGRRAKRLCAALAVLGMALEAQPVAARRPRSWPPAFIAN
jgi:Lon protease-like protein